jgi:hypothetical protein
MRFLPVFLVCSIPLFAGEPEALAIDAQLQSRHLPYGTVLDPIFAAPGSTEIAHYTRCGDSAIWTGHYLAAQAFRFAVTRSPQALANARGAFSGLKLLVDVTGTDLLARCALPQDSPYAKGVASEESSHGSFTRTLDGKTWMWIGHTSRDQYAGVFFGLGVAYDLIDDPEMRSQIASLVTRMLNRLIGWGWNIILPDGSVSTSFLVRPEQRLSFLQVGKRVNPQQFASQYSSDAGGLASQILLPLGIDVLDDKSSYFKFNLAYITLYNLIRMETSASLLGWYEQGFAVVRRTTDDHVNAHFNMIDRALHGPNAARDGVTRGALEAWLKRPRTDIFVDLRGKVPTCGSNACNPVPVDQRPPSDFVWQINPFQVTGGGSGVIESPGIDYLLPYWMGRYYRVVRTPAAPRRHGR